MALDLTTLELTVTDNLNATATVTVSGAGSGGSISVLSAPWNHQAGGRMTWTDEGTITASGAGTGSLTVAKTPGFYVWAGARMVTSTTADRLSKTVFRPVIDTADPIHSRTLDAVVTLIRSLNLSGIGSATNKVFRRWWTRFIPGTDDAAPAGGDVPQIQVGPYPQEVPMGWLTNKDDVGYPVLVAIYDDVNATMDNDMPRNLKWRRQIAAAFRAQQLAGVPEIVLTDWQPGPIAPPEGIDQGYLVGAMSFMFRSREARGLIA